MKLNAEKRTRLGTSASKQARAAGKLPAVIYGTGVDSLPVLLNLKEFEDVIRQVGANGVFEVNVEGETHNVFVKDRQDFALTPHIYHVDLLAFNAGEKVTMSIPVYVHGEETIKQGIVSQALSEVELEVSPMKAPAEFLIDVTGMEIGDTVEVGSIELPEGAELITDADELVVSITAPEDISDDLESASSTDEMPEPEVIGEDDESEEE
ncbi:50S ribosomal protein L25 [Allofustis seminis]|uniref:50S ribosomal protein L25 n=1 Tax=Allofustis seminis TaxID=166939 RepID=UPI000379E4DF|nr:50S ribosomal protein L25 [Allofustis seminis]